VRDIMSDHIIWLTERLARSILAEQLAEHGGGDGVRDEGLLASALARPRNHADYGSTAIADLAAITGIAIARNRPFVDGNKRTAYVALETFLELNGYRLTASDAESVVAMMELAASEISDDEFIDWVRMHAMPRG
jgi:death-on-curing protein